MPRQWRCSLRLRLRVKRKQRAAAPLAGSAAAGQHRRMPANYVIGIDLGTTNSVVAFAALGEEQPRFELLPIPQLVAPGVVESRTALPSFLYLAPEHETKGGVFNLPWSQGGGIVVGE